jgi:hypothetical protein
MSIRTVSILSISFAVIAFALMIHWMVDGNARDKERRALVMFAACAVNTVETPTDDIKAAWTPAEHIEHCRVSSGIRFVKTGPNTQKLEFSNL